MKILENQKWSEYLSDLNANKINYILQGTALKTLIKHNIVSNKTVNIAQINTKNYQNICDGFIFLPSSLFTIMKVIIIFSASKYS